MKIAYLLCSIYYGGVEKIVIDSLNGLCEANETLLIVPYGCEFKDRLDKRVQIYEYKSYDKRYNAFLYLEILRVLKDFGAVLLHSHGVKATQMGFVLQKFANFRLVGTKHNARKGKIFNKIKNVIAISKTVATSIKNSSKVLYFGIKPVAIKRANLPKNPFIITAVGRLDFIKGFDELIKICANLKFDFCLKIVGSGSERQNLLNLATSLGIENKVEFVGFSDEIPQILASSHLQVISSRNEGLPLVLIEGLFYSPVVISTPVGGIGEILHSDFLVMHQNMGEKICEIYENYEKIALEFEKKHSKIKENLKFESFISNLQNYYKEVLCKA